MRKAAAATPPPIAAPFIPFAVEGEVESGLDPGVKADAGSGRIRYSVVQVFVLRLYMIGVPNVLTFKPRVSPANNAMQSMVTRVSMAV